MKFQYFRMLAAENKQGELLEIISRKKFLETTFSDNKRFEFTIGKNEYTFLVQERIGDIVQAHIGKKEPLEIYDKNFTAHDEETWPPCSVLINLNDEKESGKVMESGQVIAFEVGRGISPMHCLNKLAEAINLEAKGYAFSIEAIVDEGKDFWSLVKENKDNINFVTFKYHVPNVLNLKSELEKTLKENQKKHNINDMTLTIGNKNEPISLSEYDDFLKQSANYTGQGQGDFTVGVKNEAGKITPKKSADSVKTRFFNYIQRNELNIENIKKILFGDNDSD